MAKLAGSIRATGAAGLERMGFDEAMLAAWLCRAELLAEAAPACDPAAWSKDGKAALHLAAASGSLACVELLLDRWDPQSRAGIDGFDPLSAAICNGHLDIARALAPLANPASFNHGRATALHHAAAHLPEACQLLIERWDPSALDAQGRSCLHVAIGSAHAHGCLPQLLGKANLATRGRGGLTLLEAAITHASALSRSSGLDQAHAHSRRDAAEAVALIEAEELRRGAARNPPARPRERKRL